MNRFLTFLIFSCMAFCLIGTFLSAPAAAQAFGATATPVQPPSLAFSTKNKQLQDVLHLQRQIQLLKQLIDHEKAVNEIVRSSVNLGISDPNIPTPQRSLCTELPANIPCAQAYHNLYEGFSVDRAKAEIAAPTPALPPAASILDNSDIPSLDAATLPDLPVSVFDGSMLYWTDITCLGDTCSAVITTDPANFRARYRVVPGETLPDGSVIQSISAGGVRIGRGSKTIQLEPAPNAS